MFCILQTCYPTIIFHFQFSILHLIKPFARYFRQRFAPFFRHRRRSQDYPYERACLRGIHNLFYFVSNYYSFMHKEITALCCSTRRLLKNN